MFDAFSYAPDFKADPPTVAILPIGAMEQHGAHLPVGSDLILASAFAERLARRIDCYLLPPVGISCSIEHRNGGGTVYLRTETLSRIVRDIAESLRYSKFKTLILANFHGGNWVLKPTVRELNRDFPDFRVVRLEADLTPEQRSAIFEQTIGDVHGGEFETSLLMHLVPNKVRPLPAAAASNRPFPPQTFLDYFDATSLCPCGHWGWPEKASADKGKRAFDLIVENAVQHFRLIEATAAAG